MCEAIYECSQRCIECERHRTNENPDGCPGSMGECLRGELELTKEEAAALLCAGLELNYGRGITKERIICLKCNLDRSSCIALLKSATSKLKAYIGR